MGGEGSPKQRDEILFVGYGPASRNCWVFAYKMF